MATPPPAFPRPARRLVLVGGGHAHVEVLRRFGRRPVPGVQVILVSPDPLTAYSGMVPGYIAGHYGLEDIHIDLRALARACGARLIQAEAAGLDPSGRRLILADAPPLAYDLVSFDVGAAPDLDAVPGAAAHALPAKPIGGLVARWERLRAACRTPDGPRRLVVLGGGAAGVELILALQHRLAREADAARQGDAFTFTLVSAGPLLDGHGRRFRARARRALDRHGIALREEGAEAVDSTGVVLGGGGRVEADAVLAATGAAAPGWLARTGLTLDERGFLAVEPTLQAVGAPDVFAAGDCAAFVAGPLPKAGVFAVRQGPVLAENLRRRLEGRSLLAYRPQRRWLTLLATGERSAIATREPWWAVEGAWVWRWKDWIDRRWMARYRNTLR